MFNVIHDARSLSDILGELIVARGYSQTHAQRVLENAWRIAVGEPYCHQTRVGELRHGVLNVTVAHSALLEELVAFRKAKLVEALKSSALGRTIHDIRFRVGSVAFDMEVERS
jgi:predicted nucleic acid-binding Zn ribbon protein